MNKRIKIPILITILLIHAVGFINAQTEQFKFRHLSTEDGLPTNMINKVIKDSHGMIWITTQNGLCRYDGYHFKIYQYNPSDTNSLTHNNLYDMIIEDSDGNLWIGTIWGLNKFNPYTETFTRYYHGREDPISMSSNRVRSLFQGRNGMIWIGTGLSGELIEFDPATDSFTNYQIIQLDSNEWGNILSIYEDINGFLWLGTTHGVFQFDKKKETVKPILPASPLPDTMLYSCRKILEDHQGNLWLKTDGAILKYEKNNVDSTVLKVIWDAKKEGSNCYIWDMMIDPVNGNQSLWFLACGVNILDPNSPTDPNITFIKSDPAIPGRLIGNTPRYIYKDESDILWVSTEMGLNVLDKQRSQILFNTLFFDKYQDDATVILEDSKANYWIGTNGKGILYFNTDMNLIYKYHDIITEENEIIPIGRINTILEDSHKNIWAGTVKGLFLLDRQVNKFKEVAVSWPYTQKVFNRNVFVMCEDSDGNIWMGTKTGLFQQKHEQSRSKILFDWVNCGTGTRQVRTILEDHSGYLWIGIDAPGIYCQPPELRGTEKFNYYNHEPENKFSLGNQNVMSIFEDYKGKIWIGTRYGLNKYNRDNDSFERIYFEENPGANFIFDINGDKNQNLWMTTQDGLFKLSLESDKSFIDNPYKIKKYLSYRDIYTGKISRYRDGIFFIGAKSGSGFGYFSFHPDSIAENRTVPPIVITDFLVNNQPVELDSNILFKKHITLNYKENFFSFRIAALDYTDPDQNQYAYYLEGLEDDWIYTGTRRDAYYTKVPPGDYIFRAKGSNNDSYWNETGASISITIFPPPWKTWWAYMGYALILVGLIILWRLYDLKRIRLRQQLELEHVEATKLKELDSMKSRFFANISHEFRTPLTLILGPLEKLRSKVIDTDSEKNLNMMQRNALRLQNLINQLLSLSKLESGKMKLQAREVNIVALVNGYVQSFESLAKQREIDLVFHSDKKIIPLYIDKDKIEKILYNLLSNAFKFTPEGGRIEVTVSSQRSAVSGQRSVVSLPDSIGQAGGQERSVNGKLTADCRLPTADLLENCTVISISDTGSGIAHDQLPHIFDRFYQADDSYTKDQEGTGIGLALTKELVELHHGMITTESQTGKGTIFSVYLPMGNEHLKPDEIADPAESYDNVTTDKNVIQFASSESQGMTIDDEEKDDAKPLLLIVEDNDDLRSYIRPYLADDYRISEAIDGAKGLDKAIEKIPDLVISDVMMPMMDGYQLCKALKTDERTSHIPVILLTARASMESKIEGLETGADDFITKPFDPLELQTRIKNLVEQRKKLREWILNEIKKPGLEHLVNIDSPNLASMGQKFYKQVIKTVISNVSNSEFKVEDLVSMMNMSHSQLHRKMVAVTGQTANQFIRTIRLSRAAELLANKTATVSEIAFETGFNNLSYFAKCFREQFGVLPSEYSNQ